MLSMLGFQTAAVPFGRKAHAETHKPNMACTPRAKPTQSQARSGPTYYVFSNSGSYILESQGSSHGYAGHSVTTVSPGFAQSTTPQYGPVPTSGSRPESRTATSAQQAVMSGNRNGSMNTSSSKSFRIVPDSAMPDSFIYERSEVADSDILTCYSNSSRDTLCQFPTSESSGQLSTSSTTRRHSVMLVTGSRDAASFSTTRAAPESPHPLPVSLPSSSSSLTLPSQSRPLPINGETGSRPRSGSGDSSNQRRGSISESERPVTSQPGPSPTRSSPPRGITTGGFPERTAVPSGSAPGLRDTSPARRASDPSMQADATRQRRLSGAVIPTGFGVLPGERPSRNRRDSTMVVPSGLGTADRHSPPTLHTAVPSDAKRERFSPEREVSPTVGSARERRISSTGANAHPALTPGSFFDQDRPPMRRNSQSSGSASSRERHSPQDDAPRVRFGTGPSPAIRSRTLSQGRINKGDVPKQIIVAGLETSKMVRFSENLICPSPIPLEKRRKGWFNRRGDQLWTNDGIFVAADAGTEYPLDLADYPEAGTGWQNEEGIRIDMQHRLIPKVPLRPALKRGTPYAHSQSTPGHPENRTGLSSTAIREEA